MAVFGVDYAWGRPGPTALKAAGAHFVCRYLSHDTSGKNLDRAEAKQLSDAGLWIVVVWESTASRALAGRAAGAQDARDAAAQAKACGMPAGRPIYFAVDFDATAAQQAEIDRYLDGVASELGHARVGLYGGYGPISRAFNAGTIAWGWQTYAWSGGRWDARAQLRQYSNDHTINRVGLDYDRSTTPDYGQWKVNVEPDLKPIPAPEPPMEEDQMYGQLNAGDMTPISWPKGHIHAVGFYSAGPLPVTLAITVHGGKAQTWTLTLDPGKPKAVLHLVDAANVDAISVRRTAGDAAVSWDAT